MLFVMIEGDPNDRRKTSVAPVFRKGQEESLGAVSFALAGPIMDWVLLDRAWRRQQLEPVIMDEANCA